MAADAVDNQWTHLESLLSGVDEIKEHIVIPVGFVDALAVNNLGNQTHSIGKFAGADLKTKIVADQSVERFFLTHILSLSHQ